MLKRIINLSSVGSFHGGIVSSLPVSCQVSMHCDKDLRCLKATVFTHLVFSMTDNLIICRAGRNFDF